MTPIATPQTQLEAVIFDVVFLCSPENKVASIAILNLDEAGDMGASANVLFAWLG